MVVCSIPGSVIRKCNTVQLYTATVGKINVLDTCTGTCDAVNYLQDYGIFLPAPRRDLYVKYSSRSCKTRLVI